MWGQVDTWGWFLWAVVCHGVKSGVILLTNLILGVGFYDSRMLGYIYHELSKYWAEYMTLTLSI